MQRLPQFLIRKLQDGGEGFQTREPNDTPYGIKLSPQEEDYRWKSTIDFDLNKNQIIPNNDWNRNPYYKNVDTSTVNTHEISMDYLPTPNLTGLQPSLTFGDKQKDMSSYADGINILNPLIRGISEASYNNDQKQYQEANTGNPENILPFSNNQSENVKYGYNIYRGGGEVNYIKDKEYDVSDEELENLKKLGYKFKIL